MERSTTKNRFNKGTEKLAFFLFVACLMANFYLTEVSAESNDIPMVKIDQVNAYISGLARPFAYLSKDFTY